MQNPRPAAPKELAILPKGAEAPKLWAKRYFRHPGNSERPHVHQFFELVYVEGGRGFHLIDGERFEAREGDLFWMRPGQLHDPGGLANTQKWIVAFGASAVVPELNDSQLYSRSPCLPLLPFTPVAAGARQAKIPKLERPRWVERFEAMARELESRELGYGDAASAMLRLILVDLVRLSVPDFGELSPGRPLLAQVFAFIEARYKSPIGLREVAEAVRRSPAYLTDLVRRETGRTVLQWVIDRRLSEARRLLLQSEAPISEIAAEVGYCDSKHFAAQFRRAHGLSPNAWRAIRQGRRAGRSA